MTPIRIGSQWRDRTQPDRIVVVVGANDAYVSYRDYVTGCFAACKRARFVERFELVSEPTTAEMLADYLRRRVEGL